jgi:hypothetical protein
VTSGQKKKENLLESHRSLFQKLMPTWLVDLGGLAVGRGGSSTISPENGLPAANFVGQPIFWAVHEPISLATLANFVGHSLVIYSPVESVLELF